MINFVIYKKSNKLKNSRLHLRNPMAKVPLEKQIACKLIKGEKQMLTFLNSLQKKYF